jgi:peptide/nickel transport system substrate-binding protein
MIKRKLFVVASIAISSMLLFTACLNKDKNIVTKKQESIKSEGYLKAKDMSKEPEEAKKRTDTLVIGVTKPEQKFNPLYAEAVSDKYIVDAMFDGLMSVTENGTCEGNLAKDYKISDDGLTYTFTLGDNLKFSDGSKLTAEDVAFTYTLACDNDYEGSYDFINNTQIQGAKEYNSGKSNSVSGIKVLNNNTIQITLEKARAGAIYDFTLGILSKDYYGKDYTQGNLSYIQKFFTNPMGCGQYKFVSYDKDKGIKLEANKEYFKGAPKIQNIIFKTTGENTKAKLLQDGDVDVDMISVSKDNVTSMQETGFLDLSIFPVNEYGYIGFNEADKKLADPKVRQALTYGLNREKIVSTAFQGYANVINIPQSSKSWAYKEPKNKYEFDLDKAKKLLDEAGWKVSSDGKREKNGEKFEIKFVASNPNPVNEAITQIAKENYAKLGIEFNATQANFNELRSQVAKGDTQMFLMGWELNPDPDITNIFGTNKPQNQVKYSNSKVDELLSKGAQTTDISQRKEIYGEVYDVLNEELPYMFMYQRNSMCVINGRVKGLEDKISSYKSFISNLYKAEIS